MVINRQINTKRLLFIESFENTDYTDYSDYTDKNYVMLNEDQRMRLTLINNVVLTVEKLFNQAILKITLSASKMVLGDKTFDLDKFPFLKNVVDSAMQELRSNLSVTIVNSLTAAWTLSDRKNDALAVQAAVDYQLSIEAAAKIFNKNDGLFKSFLDRKADGVTLSDRVWNAIEPFKTELEASLAIGINDGQSAADMARTLRKYLNNPDALYRRVRQIKGDPNSKLKLSRAAKNFHPGQGVYRSAFKNAIRLTATETNLAYQTADYNRWKNMSFIRGIVVKTSNSHPEKDICDYLAGEYPPDFFFTAWHPSCLCHAEPLLSSIDQFNQLEQFNQGSIDTAPDINRITSIPEKAQNWIQSNAETINGWKNTPYWVDNNPDYISEFLNINQ